MNEDLNAKLFMAFCGALIAIALKVLVDYVTKRLELKRTRSVLESDLAHQCHSAANFIQEKQKLYLIYKEALDGYLNGRPSNFYEKLRITNFGEVFFSDETFKTIKKSDLLSILGKNQINFGNLHNIYHIANRLKDRSMAHYENLFDEHLLAYIGDNKNPANIFTSTQLALQFITSKLEADIKTANLLMQMTFNFLSHFADQSALKEKFGLEIGSLPQSV